MNKQHNSDDCSQPPDHFEFNSGGFFVVVMRPVLMTRMVVKIHSIQFRITTKIEMKKGEIRMPYDVKRFIFSVS
ncbi:MAG: hypothetical protein Q4C08_03815, partial [Pseudomonadota bacterium]|nr:hypothetical protein [Pseudomonadota bacterium]